MTGRKAPLQGEKHYHNGTDVVDGLVDASSDVEFTLYDEGVILFTGDGGDIQVELTNDREGTAGTVYTLPEGTFLPLRVRKIISTGTTATNIIALI